MREVGGRVSADAEILKRITLDCVSKSQDLVNVICFYI